MKKLNVLLAIVTIIAIVIVVVFASHRGDMQQEITALNEQVKALNAELEEKKGLDEQVKTLTGELEAAKAEAEANEAMIATVKTDLSAVQAAIAAVL